MIRVESPFPEYAIPRMWRWLRSIGSWRVTDDYGPQTEDEFIDHWREMLGAEGCQSWGVYQDDELGGVITVQYVTPNLSTAHLLFNKTFFGAHITIPAAREVFDLVFQSGTTRIESYVFEDNGSILGLAKKLGAVNEGRLRKRTIRKGRPIDLIILGLLKEDFYKRIEEEQTCHLSPSAPPSPEPLPLPADSVIDPAPPKPPAAANAS